MHTKSPTPFGSPFNGTTAAEPAGSSNPGRNADGGPAVSFIGGFRGATQRFEFTGLPPPFGVMRRVGPGL